MDEKHARMLRTLQGQSQTFMRDFKEGCLLIKEILVAVENPVLQLKSLVPQPPDVRESEFGEMIANIMLAYRHLEDANMRLGKAIRIFDVAKSTIQGKKYG